jgi:hypothetical protein
MDDYLPTADKMWSSSLTVEHGLTLFRLTVFCVKGTYTVSSKLQRTCVYKTESLSHPLRGLWWSRVEVSGSDISVNLFFSSAQEKFRACTGAEATRQTIRKMRAPIVCWTFEPEILITLALADDEDDHDDHDDYVRIRSGLMWLGVGGGDWGESAVRTFAFHVSSPIICRAGTESSRCIALLILKLGAW